MEQTQVLTAIGTLTTEVRGIRDKVIQLETKYESQTRLEREIAEQRAALAAMQKESAAALATLHASTTAAIATLQQEIASSITALQKDNAVLRTQFSAALLIVGFLVPIALRKLGLA